MRSRRQIRPAMPGYQLALPTETSLGEVQVQQRNEQDVNRFFIDVDDTLVSPMITTAPQFDAAKYLCPRPHTQPTAAGPSHVGSSAPAGNGPSSAAAKFIHVNNTNLFVLMDGISMFVEGKSTFNGAQDPALMQQVRRRRAEGRGRAAASMGSSVDGGGARGVDTVEKAIRDLERVDPHASSPSGMATRVTSGTHLDDMNSTTVSCDCSVSSLPQSYVDLFQNATRPTVSPLFRRRHAKQPPAPPPPAVSPAEEKPSPSSLTSPSSPVSPADGFSRQRSHSTTSSVSNASSPHVPQVYHGPSLRRHGGRSALARRYRQRLYTTDDVGRSNRWLDLDEVEMLYFIGSGSQGDVWCVKVDGKIYAMKKINVNEAVNATNAIERQGRKRGLVKELNMIRLQRSMPAPPKYLMQMFNCVATLSGESQELSLLIEIMSFSVEDAQKMVARMPAVEITRLTQSNFRNHIAGDRRSDEQLEEMFKTQMGCCRRLLGRSRYNHPENWERHIDRQTPVPEVVLSILAADVLRGLRELHEDYNIVHCDLKPDNVLLSFDRQSFKLADFGCGCVMDNHTGEVRRSGVDLGSKLYKAPERLANELNNDSPTTTTAAAAPHDSEEGLNGDVVEFTSKADVWSLGVMLLELSGGVHPCNSFKSDFWNYANLLKLSKMIKPMSWSCHLCDFVTRCVCVDVSKRWSVQQLLRHPFILKYDNVPRQKLRSFMEKLEHESANFQRKQQRELLQQQILLSRGMLARDNDRNHSRAMWRSFTGFLSVAPQITDHKTFPKLE